MEFRHLRYFVGIAQMNSFSMAARTLGVAQPALSRHMQHLERELGASLFQRHAKGISLTSAGHLFLVRASQILADVDASIAEVSRHGAEIRGKHTLGMPIPIASLLMEQLYGEGARRYPGIELHLIEGFSGLLPEWLTGGSLDAAILYSADTTAVNVIPLLTENLYLAGASNSALRLMKSCSLSDISSLPIIMPHRPHPVWTILDRYGVVPRHTIDADAIGIMKRLASQGKGYVLLPLSSIHKEVESGELIARPMSDPALTREVFLCYSKLRPVTPSLQAILNLVRQEVRQLVENGGWPSASLVHLSDDPSLALPTSITPSITL